MTITEFVYQDLYKNVLARAVALDISKAFDTIWHFGPLHNLKGYSIRRRIFSVQQCFLTNLVRKLVLTGYASSSFHIKAVFRRDLFLGPTF